MALDLNDPKAVDYSSKQDLLPYEAYGTYLLDVISYVESGPANSAENEADKEFDIALCRVIESTNPEIPVGSVTGFWFQTGGNGVTKENRAYKAGALRAFHAGVIGANLKTFDGNAAKAAMLAEDLSSGGNLVRLTASRGKPVRTKEKEQAYRKDKETEEFILDAEGNKIPMFYRNDVWSAHTA